MKIPFGDVHLGIMKRIKEIFDPRNLESGKIFPTE